MSTTTTSEGSETNVTSGDSSRHRGSLPPAIELRDVSQIFERVSTGELFTAVCALAPFQRHVTRWMPK